MQLEVSLSHFGATNHGVLGGLTTVCGRGKGRGRGKNTKNVPYHFLSTTPNSYVPFAEKFACRRGAWTTRQDLG